jgi:protein gp37
MASKIEWTEETWNPVVGCTKCSPGCENCYAERMGNRLAGMALKEANRGPLPDNKKSRYVYSIGPDKKWNGFIDCLEDELDKPLHWRKPRKIFVCSMSDSMRKCRLSLLIK